MLTGTLSGLRGPFCPRLASAFNHRPEEFEPRTLYPGEIEKASYFLCHSKKTGEKQEIYTYSIDKNDLKKRNDFLNLPHHSLTNIKENGKNKIGLRFR